MNTKKKIAYVLAISFILFVVACGTESKKKTGQKKSSKTKTEQKAEDQAKTEKAEESKPSAKGVGEVENVPLTDKIDQEMAKKGEAIYEMKCVSCHKLSDQKVVGPGWEGITNRRTPEWIMNMITNVDMMLAEDPEAQKLLEECMVRMPNQNVSVGDARAILEFMRQNDKQRVGKYDEAVSG